MPPQERCRVCNSKDLEKVFSLGKQPLANGFLASPEENPPMYPLELCRCPQCTLLQLSWTVPKEELYQKYAYIPSISQTNLEHFHNLSSNLINELKLSPGSFVVDIGSNDGSLLKYFKEQQMKVLGIEPSGQIVVLARNNGIPTVENYFDIDTATDVSQRYGKAKLITMTNVLAHIDNLKEFLICLDILLDKDGVFFAQFPDNRNLLRENQFDTIYHEHVSYFTYEPLYYLFAHSPFELFRVDESKIHGGSMQIYVRRRPALLEELTRNAEYICRDLRYGVIEEKIAGRKVVGFGAAAKGTVLLNAAKLDNTLIHYVADGTPFKQGKYIPGVNIPIVPEETLQTDKPDTILILAWNFKEEIMEKLAWGKFDFIIPIPKVEVIKYGE